MSRRRGFTLIELLIVVIIVGIVSGLAAMNYGRYSGRGVTFKECQYEKMAERTIRTILAAERAYRMTEDLWTDDLNRLPISDVNIRSAEDHPIEYEIVSTDAAGDTIMIRAHYTRRSLDMEAAYDMYTLQSNPDPGVVWRGYWCTECPQSACN